MKELLVGPIAIVVKSFQIFDGHLKLLSRSVRPAPRLTAPVEQPSRGSHFRNLQSQSRLMGSHFHYTFSRQLWEGGISLSDIKWIHLRNLRKNGFRPA